MIYREVKMISGFDIVKEKKISKAIAIKVNGTLMDLSTTLETADEVEVLDINAPESLAIMRHSTSHLMAQAVQELFPNCKVAIGPVIENGFYYDFDCDHVFKEEDFEKIEAKMLELIKENLKIERKVLSRGEAIKLFKEKNEPYKVELIEGIDADTVTIYSQGNYVDLCRGPHVPSTGSLPKAFKIQKVAGAYWRGNSKNKMLQRLYATSWRTKDELKEYLHNLEEAEKRDHRKLAREMDLFHMQEEAAGCIFWHPKGWKLYNALKLYMRKRIEKDGYVEVCTPQIVDRALWEASGHWDKYRENMFIAESEDRILAIKPMNCPGAIQIFNQGIKSYRDLPLRMAEFGCCHRNEPSGSLYGCMRVRGFTQDDAHIFCTPEQINAETKRFCVLLSKVYRDLGFDSFKVKFSDRPAKRTGSNEIWDLAEDLLQKATVEAGLEYTINKGEGAFYGPKLEFVLKDKLGRDWQCGTLQVDFQLPQKLGAYYVGEDGEKHHPIMLHRAVLGSLERFIGILLENYGGWLPLWLAPTQAVVATITNDCDDYANKIFNLLDENNVRVSLDKRAEKISYKIREHVTAKVPMVIVVGRNEEENQKVTVRYHDGKQEEIAFDKLLQFMKDKIQEPVID